MALWVSRAACSNMSLSSMSASRAGSRPRPRTSWTTRTSLSRIGRSWTTARMASTTSAGAGREGPRASSRARRQARRALSERIADREMEVRRRFVRTPVQLVAPIHADGAEGRPVAQPEAGRIAQVAQVDVPHQGVDVAGIEEGPEGEPAAQAEAQLGPAEDEGVAPRGKELPVRSEREGTRRIQREAARAVVPPCEETLGKRQP